MDHQRIKQAIADADQAITCEDFDALLGFYAEDAALVIKPGLIAKGREQIRRAFVAIAEHFNHKLKVTQGDVQVIEGAGTALVIMEIILETIDAKGMPSRTTRRATYVFRKEPDDRWLCVVDNSYGTDLLDAT